MEINTSSAATNPIATTMNNSVLLYNTQNIDPHVLKAGFSIRKEEYQRIWNDIRSGTMQRPEVHYLIQGVRGAGKTTLLSRLANEVVEDKNLNKWLIPILLNEEEYGILSLFTFWLRIAEKLAEQMPQNYSILYQRLNDLDISSLNEAEVAWELIRESLDKYQQKIIVFVDNLGELFKDFDEIEEAQLREVLSFHPHIRLIGGSSEILDAHFDGNAPFYQFFKLINLKPINEVDMHELLRSLAKQTSEEAVQTIEEIITQYPERIEAVRRLTDGVPRTIVLLFQIIMEGAKESSYAYLEETIDKTTPLYKHRMDDLPKQQRAIVHTIAMNWDAMSAKEIAEQTRLPSKTVSAQLVKLQKQWIVDKIETNTKNHLYIIKERFFNIWYLMRYGSQTDKRRVLWLTRFLESWYDKNELNFKLVELVQPYIELYEENKSYKLGYSQELYVNALLASNFIDESLKIGANIYLEPYYSNLINSLNYKAFKNHLTEFYDDIDNKNFEEARLKIADIIGLDIGISELLICLELISSFFRADKHLIEQVQAEIYLRAKRSSMSLYVLFMSIMEIDFDSAKRLGKEIADSIVIDNDNPRTLIFMIFKAYVLLWFDEFESYSSIIKTLEKNGFEFVKRIVASDFLENLLILMIMKKQLEMVYSIMSRFNHVKDKYKPIYYATVSLLQDERRQEYLRMGPELQSTVDEILTKVDEYQIKYA
jgi:DNA-binding MarR family transcriptional regulator